MAGKRMAWGLSEACVVICSPSVNGTLRECHHQSRKTWPRRGLNFERVKSRAATSNWDLLTGLETRSTGFSTCGIIPLHGSQHMLAPPLEFAIDRDAGPPPSMGREAQEARWGVHPELIMTYVTRGIGDIRGKRALSSDRHYQIVIRQPASLPRLAAKYIPDGSRDFEVASLRQS
jgi:hypothetical protein